MNIPNLLTLSNLFFGCCALVYTINWRPEIAAWFTLGSFIADYLDGMAARALKIDSPLGKELDSLADVISFGAVPGAMLYQLIFQTVCAADITDDPAARVCIAALPAFVLSMFSALRLGKFNLDTRQTNYFIGLSTPACTLFILGLTLGARQDRFGIAELIHNQWLLYGLTGVLSWLLVSEIPMFGMKVKGLSLRKNAVLLAFIVLFGILVFFLRELALSAIILCYIGYSLLQKEKIVQS